MGPKKSASTCSQGQNLKRAGRCCSSHKKPLELKQTETPGHPCKVPPPRGTLTHRISAFPKILSQGLKRLLWSQPRVKALKALLKMQTYYLAVVIRSCTHVCIMQGPATSQSRGGQWAKLMRVWGPGWPLWGTAAQLHQGGRWRCSPGCPGFRCLHHISWFVPLVAESSDPPVAKFTHTHTHTPATSLEPLS